MSQQVVEQAVFTQETAVGTSHPRLVNAVQERDRKLAAQGWELGLLRGRLKESMKRCESAERVLTSHQQDEMHLRTEVDSLKSKAQGLQAVLDRAYMDLDRKEKELALEHQKRCESEAEVAVMCRHVGDIEKTAKNQISKLQETPKKTLHEIELLRRSLNDQENVITVLRQENYRLVQLLKQHGISSSTTSEPPDYHRLIAQHRLKDVPSFKSFQKMNGGRSISASRTPSPTSLVARVSTGRAPSPSGLAARSPVNRSRSKSPNVASSPAITQADTYAKLETAPVNISGSRSKSPVVPRVALGAVTQSFRVGQNVQWKSFMAVVRFIGELHCAEGPWVGIELSTKNGDHAGAIDGIQYFRSPPKTGVFCRMWELIDAKGVMGQSGAEAPTTVPLSSPPPSTVAQLKDFKSLYENL